MEDIWEDINMELVASPLVLQGLPPLYTQIDRMMKTPFLILI